MLFGRIRSKPTTNPYPTFKPASSDKPLFPTQLTVTANQVRMRSGPGLNYPTIGSLNKGDKVVDLMQMHHQDGYSWHKVQVNGANININQRAVNGIDILHHSQRIGNLALHRIHRREPAVLRVIEPGLGVVHPPQWWTTPAPPSSR